MDSILTATGAASQCDRLVAIFAADPAGIANLGTELFALNAGKSVVPTSVNDAKDAPTCYLCCASAAYIDYAREELRNFEGSPATKLAMQLLLRLAAPIVKATGFD